MMKSLTYTPSHAHNIVLMHLLHHQTHSLHALMLLYIHFFVLHNLIVITVNNMQYNHFYALTNEREWKNWFFFRISFFIRHYHNPCTHLFSYNWVMILIFLCVSSLKVFKSKIFIQFCVLWSNWGVHKRVWSYYEYFLVR